MLFDLVLRACQQTGSTWVVTQASSESSFGGLNQGGWIRASPAKSAAAPTCGWKIHVSSTPSTAVEVLNSCLPVLLRSGVVFKIADLPLLTRLNQGEAGLSQIGKFLTVYPDQDRTVDLAGELDEVTRGMRGPIPPSNRALRASSVVSYRYGSFRTVYLQLPVGSIIPAAVRPDGTVLPDPRLPYYVRPEGVADPFTRIADLQAPEDLTIELLDDRYLIVACLMRSARGSVYEAIELDGARPCIIKHAPRDRLLDESGTDARNLLTHEAEVLRVLQPDSRFPRVLDLIPWHMDLCLVEEHFAGEPLSTYVLSLAARGEWIGRERFLGWAEELLSMLLAIRDAGWCYRDLKSANLIVAPTGTLHLVDFELATRTSEAQDGQRRRTRGYVEVGSPDGCHRDSRVYAVGAVLYLLATGGDPVRAPAGCLLRRPIAALNPAVDNDIRILIERCVSWDHRAPITSLDGLAAALRVMDGATVVSAKLIADAAPTPFAYSNPDHVRQVAAQLGDSVCAAAKTCPQGNGSLYWPSVDDPTGRLVIRDINSGTSGITLTLAELAQEFGDRRYLETVEGAVASLLDRSSPYGERLPGLYVGEAGVGAALLRSGQILRDESMVEAALRQARLTAGLPHASPDLFNGTAGRLRFHALLWDETGESDQLAAVRAAVDILSERADRGREFAGWRIPAGYSGLSQMTYLGYAHGVAGIADALLDAFEITDDERCADLAVASTRWLTSLSVPMLADGSGVGWPVHPGGSSASAPYWCHGAAGIGKFLVRVAGLNLVPGAADLARRAGAAVEKSSSWAGPTQCHGLAGNIEFLLDLYQAFDETRWRDAAQHLADLLDAFRYEANGHTVWDSDRPDVIQFGYLTGYSGIAACLLRLSTPETRPAQLSRHGFRYFPAR